MNNITTGFFFGNGRKFIKTKHEYKENGNYFIILIKSFSFHFSQMEINICLFSANVHKEAKKTEKNS